MNKELIICLALSIGSSSYAGDCQWVTVYVNEDTTALEAFPNLRQNPEDEVLRVSAYNSSWQNGVPGRERVFLRFDTTGIEPGYVESASFQIYQTDSIIYPGQFALEEIVVDWEQNLITWNNQPEVAAEPIAMIDNGADQWITAESAQLGSTIENWLRFPEENHGLRIRFEDESYNGTPNGVRGDSFRSREVAGELPASVTVLVCEPCEGDFDFNRQVDFFDVSAFLVYYQTGADLADLNGDGMINFFDVSEMLTAYSMCD